MSSAQIVEQNKIFALNTFYLPLHSSKYFMGNIIINVYISLGKWLSIEVILSTVSLGTQGTHPSIQLFIWGKQLSKL